MNSLRFTFLAALLATATASPPSAGSSGERALFGANSGEGALFGTSSHLFGAPKPQPSKEDKDKDIEAVAFISVSTKKKASVVTPPASAFINHHPLNPNYDF